MGIVVTVPILRPVDVISDKGNLIKVVLILCSSLIMATKIKAYC